MPIPDNLHLALVTPEVAIPTAEARAVMPSHVSLPTLIHQTGKVARLIDALHRGDLQAMAEAMENDLVAEPARASLMPHLQDVRRAAKAAGALAVFIGGAGPTLCALCDAKSAAEVVAGAMKKVYSDRELESRALSTRVDRRGSIVIHAE